MAPSTATAMRAVFENEDLCQEILVRVSSDPKLLVRLTAVCRGWHGHLTNPDFLRRYRLAHGDPPMIGYIQNTAIRHHPQLATFVSAIPGFTAQVPRNGDDMEVLDSRHGRVLFLLNGTEEHRSFILWDPVADLEEEVRMPDDFGIPFPSRSHFAAAVLCEAYRFCDHRSCHHGPFRLLFVGFGGGHISAFVYSSESDLWTSSSATAIAYHHQREFRRAPPALVGRSLYFMTTNNILRCEFGLEEAARLSFVNLPVDVSFVPLFGGSDIHGAVLVPSTDRVTLAVMYRGRRSSRIRFWDTATAASTGDVQWEAQAEAKIPGARAKLVGCGASSLFIRLPRNGFHGVTRFDLGSGRLHNLQDAVTGRLSGLVPFVSFYEPSGVALLVSGPTQDVASSGDVAIEQENTASTSGTDGELQ